MKLVLVIVLLLAFTSAKPLISMPKVTLSVTPQEIQQWVQAFFEGMQIDDITNASAECQVEVDKIFSQTAVAVNAFQKGEWYIGLMNLTTAFGYFSPMTRACASTIDEISKSLAKYEKQFENWDDFVSKVSLNIMGNIQPLKMIGGQIIAEYLGNRNMSQIFFYSGQMLKIALVISPEVLKYPAPYSYTDTNPFAPDPLKSWIWTPMECTYHFLTESKWVNADYLAMCEGATANFLLDTQAGFRYERKGDWRNAIFAWADAFSYTHDMVEGCVATGNEFGSNAGKVWKQRIINGKMFSNILGNFWGVLNASFFMGAEIFYNDIINIFGAAGALAYPLWIKGL